MKILSLIISLLFSVVVVGQSTAKEDSLCLANTEQAKKDYEAGQLKFCANASWDYPFARMYSILDSLCTVAKLRFTPYPFEEHETGFDPYVCYTRFMDSLVTKQYGQNFKTQMYRLADSIFKAKHQHDTIPAFYCDKKPGYSGKRSLEKEFFKNFVLTDSCTSLINCKTCDYRVIFLVDLNGHASSYRIYHSTPGKCDAMIDQGIIDALEKINKWRPGILGNHPIASYGDLLINFSDRSIK